MTEKMWKTQKHMTSFNFLIAVQFLVHPAIRLNYRAADISNFDNSTIL